MYAQPPRHNSQVPGIIVGLLIAVLAYVMYTGSLPMPSNVSLPSGLNGATAPKPRPLAQPPVAPLTNSAPLPNAAPIPVNPPAQDQGYIRSCADFKSTEVAPPECAGAMAQPTPIDGMRAWESMEDICKQVNCQPAEGVPTAEVPTECQNPLTDRAKISCDLIKRGVIHPKG